MRVRTTGVLALAVTALAGVGCESQQEKDQYSLLEQENTELRAQLGERDKALNAANDELKQANRLLREQHDQYETTTGQLQSQIDARAGAFDDIAGVTATYGPNDVTVSVEGDVLFESGRSSLKSAAKRSLDKVAQVLGSSYSGQSIIIAGHTDADPIRKSGHKSNHHLAFERGWAVRNYLSGRGISETDMAVMSYGPDRPKNSKQQSRRVEIVVAQ